MDPNPEIRDFLTTAIDERESFNHWQRSPTHCFSLGVVLGLLFLVPNLKGGFHKWGGILKWMVYH